MVYWPAYNRFGTRIAGDVAFFYVFNGQHCLAYLGLLFHMAILQCADPKRLSLGQRGLLVAHSSLDLDCFHDRA